MGFGGGSNVPPHRHYKKSKLERKNTPKIKSILRNVLHYPEYSMAISEISLKRLTRQFLGKFSGSSPPPPTNFMKLRPS
jgi:hypothetical protein